VKLGTAARAHTMSAHLIIDARDRLPWHQRLASDAGTALLWSGWLWLWAPLVERLALAFASAIPLGVRLGPSLAKAGAVSAAAGSLEHPVVAFVGASGTLLFLNRLPAPRAEAAPEVTLREQARQHGLAEAELRGAREASVCVVHHDAQGRIVRLEPREAAAQARRSA
jgi:poly-beta-1,6-N-acetyl-D-glucosamine biosynthesis protein PgaD